MDWASVVEDTELTRFHPQTDGQRDNVKPVYPTFNFIEAGGCERFGWGWGGVGMGWV